MQKQKPNQAQPSPKASLKALRQERKAFIKAATAKMKRQKTAITAIRRQLRSGAQTVPDLATAVGASTDETLWYVAALKKYGQITEGQKAGGYFQYELASTDAPDPSAESSAEMSTEISA